MQEGRRSSPLGPQRSRTKVPRRGTFSSKQLVFSWLKFLCEALGRSSLRTKLRASSMHLHGLTNKIGSSTRSVSSMHREGRGDFSESVNSYMLKYAHANCAILLSNPYNKIPGPILASQQPRSARDQPMVQAECRERATFVAPKKRTTAIAMLLATKMAGHRAPTIFTQEKDSGSCCLLS